MQVNYNYIIKCESICIQYSPLLSSIWILCSAVDREEEPFSSSPLAIDICCSLSWISRCIISFCFFSCTTSSTRSFFSRWWLSGKKEISRQKKRRKKIDIEKDKKCKDNWWVYGLYRCFQQRNHIINVQYIEDLANTVQPVWQNTLKGEKKVNIYRLLGPYSIQYLEQVRHLRSKLLS